MVLALGCGKLLGITDTTVTAGSGGTDAVGNVGGSAGEVVGAGGTTPSGSGGAGGDDALGAGQGGALAGGGTGGAEPSAACTEGQGRCVAAGRELCTNGAFVAAACPIDTPTCEAGACIVRGPALVPVANGLFFIDATEVTVAHYAEFLAAMNGDVSGQPADTCGWNTTYEPTALPDPPDFPASNIDWCDARAYCEWAGKHLCRSVGSAEPVAYADLFTTGVSQWFTACGGPNGAFHVSANANDPTLESSCNSSGGFGNLEPVGTNSDCEGYYPGVFDLEGNVAEWIDSCQPSGDAGLDSPNDRCMLMGGNLIDQVSFCAEVYDEYTRQETAPTFGFRCCAG
jgi:hypothetical protein